MAYQMDFFAGIESKVTAAISAGKVQYPAYVFVRDEEASATGRLAFVDQNNVLKFIRGENEEKEVKQQVVNVTELPEVGDTEVLYILNGIVYTFDGTEFKAQFVDHTDELEALDTRVTALEGKVVELEAADTSIAEQIATLEEKIEAIEIPEECKCGDKYEVSSKPEGTLVDYREKEIRVMCPADTEFVLQQSGANADANKYYIGVKAYAPNEDVVSFKEAIDKTVSDNTMYYFENNEFAGVDADGRKYSIIWLPVAVYENDVWTYYGTNSSTEHYIGWYYSVEWYNADGVVIASDCIRINLSNEECYSAIEPYYIGELKAEVETLKESNADVVEKLGTITEQVTEFEERIVEVEKATLTFVELE